MDKHKNKDAPHTNNQVERVVEIIDNTIEEVNDSFKKYFQTTKTSNMEVLQLIHDCEIGILVEVREKICDKLRM